MFKTNGIHMHAYMQIWHKIISDMAQYPLHAVASHLCLGSTGLLNIVMMPLCWLCYLFFDIWRQQILPDVPLSLSVCFPLCSQTFFSSSALGTLDVELLLSPFSPFLKSERICPTWMSRRRRKRKSDRPRSLQASPPFVTFHTVPRDF